MSKPNCCRGVVMRDCPVRVSETRTRVSAVRRHRRMAESVAQAAEGAEVTGREQHGGAEYTKTHGEYPVVGPARRASRVLPRWRIHKHKHRTNPGLLVFADS